MHFTRRDFVRAGLATAGLALAGGDRSFARSGEGPAERPEMAKLRQRAKKRRRRIIYNSDGNDANVTGIKSAEDFYAVRFNHLLNTNVDSVFYCTGATTMFTHLAKVGETYGEFINEKSNEWSRNVKATIQALKALGHDILTLSADFCHKHGFEIFFSHRINDIHDCVSTWSESELSRWKREHPEYLMGKKGDFEKYGADSPKAWWTALDFEVPEVLDYLYRILEDVCQRYDVDGIEIDYFRSPLLFRPNLEYKPATPRQRDLLTAFQRRIRRMTHRVGAQRGRPLLVAVRTPMIESKCLHVGIDLVRWMQQDLIDLFVAGGGYVPFTQPNAESVRLGHAHGVPVYPAVNASGMRSGDWTKLHYDTPEGWRGVASNIWASGADGVYAFNIFPEREKGTGMSNVDWGPAADVDPRFTEIGDPQRLATLDKLFAIDQWTCAEGDLAQGIVQDQVLPKPLPPDGSPLDLNLPVGDDLAAAASARKLKSAELRVRIAGLTRTDHVSIKLNGRVLKVGRKDTKGGWLTCRPNAKVCRKGRNRLALAVTKRAEEADKPLSANAVELRVDYG